MVIVALVGGCKSGDDLYPLKVGNEWSYNVRTGLAQYVEPVKVSREVAAAGINGVEVSGPMGASRLAWRGKTLFASSFPNLRVAQGDAPIPVLVDGEKKAERSWSGRLEYLGRTQKANATLKQDSETIKLGGKSYDTTRANLTLAMPNRNIELITWYSRGLGPIRQEQRTNGTWDVGLEYLGGP